MNAPAKPDPQPSGRPRRLPRLAATGVTVATLGALAAAAIQVGRFSTDPPAVDAPALPRSATLQVPAPPSAGPRPGQPAMGGPGWRVISANSVSGVLMVILETERLDDMTAIAREVVTPAAAQLLEALVYFHLPGASRASGRVQWTPDHGYIPLTFAE
ncbi:MAG: hypothetical protein OXG04_07130 [Acidobacteria bacterium]|nr:hypothetical protein [Acidobacteriota bacterium]